MIPITKLDYLLSSLGEESGELQQAIGKAMRFGLLDTNVKKPKGPNNWVNLKQELHDVVAVYEVLCDEFDRVEELDRDLIDKKKKKILKWLGYAKKLNRVQDK